MGRYDDAMDKYDQSLKLDQEFDQTYLLRGDVYLARTEYERAVEMYDKALEFAEGGDLAQAHSALGYTYAQMGRYDDAIAQNLTVLQDSPNDYVSLRNLSLLYEQTGRYIDALRTAELALPGAPDFEKQALQQLIEELRGKVATPAPPATK